jgi:hypothetical protein
MPLTTALSLPSKVPQVKMFPVTRAMTAGTDRAFVIPKNAILMGFVLQGTPSDAGTTATLSIGTTSGTPTEFVNAVSVLTGGSGGGVSLLKGVNTTNAANTIGGKFTSDTIVYVKYAETGTASANGNWNLYAVYFTNSSNQTGVFQ